ncbi:yolk cathepsin [Clonorchis sinensis]|uniref:Yolk cathepsin n=1 Tax=Clonorchis sinensis TaxID=79923 RepID=G7YBM5_CLOSI|nr:yolk cathepsin [Clonorchis sinensis]
MSTTSEDIDLCETGLVTIFNSPDGTISEIQLEKTAFGLAVKRDKLFFLPEGIDGSFGVPIRGSHHSEQWDFINKLIIDDYVTYPYFTVSFSCTAAGEDLEPGGTLVVGRFHVRGMWTNEVVSLSTEKWQLPLFKVSIGSESVRTANHFIEPDLTQPFLVGPEQLIKKINRILKATPEGDSGIFLMDCNQQYPHVKIKFNEDAMLAVQPLQYIVKLSKTIGDRGRVHHGY